MWVGEAGPAGVGTGGARGGAAVAKRRAARMGGGLGSLTLLTLLVIPAAYVIWRGHQLKGWGSSPERENRRPGVTL